MNFSFWGVAFFGSHALKSEFFYYEEFNVTLFV